MVRTLFAKEPCYHYGPSDFVGNRLRNRVFWCAACDDFVASDHVPNEEYLVAAWYAATEMGYRSGR
jgi:hypothetical protein